MFSQGKVKKHPVFLFGNDQLDVVSDYVYLGTKFNYNGSFNKAIAKQVNQAKRALYSLKTKALKLNLPVDIQCELFDKMIVPILLYGCEVWGFQKLDAIESFHKKFLKNLLRVNKSTANCMAYGELGRTSLESVVEQRMVNFWIHLTEGKQSKLTSTILSLLQKLHDDTNNDFESKWISKIKSVLDRCGYSNIWNDHSNVNKVWLRNSINLRLKDISTQTWHNNVETNRLCLNYRIFKEENKMESYLTKLSLSERTTLARFRCGNHNLPISETRYLNEETIKVCPLCDLGPGDELHYVLVCPIFRDYRSKFVKRYYYVRPNCLKMFQLFNSQSRLQLSNLAKFTQIIMSQVSVK